MWAEAKRTIRAAVQLPARFLIAHILRPALPLAARKRMVVQLSSLSFLARSFLCQELLRDLAESDCSDFHRFLWANHVGGLSYAKTYDVPHRFGNENLRTSRRELFEFLRGQLREDNLEPERDVHSVFDVGCSLGYTLRFLETELFPAATCLRGVDVDRYAIETGNAYLRTLGSKIEIVAGDVSELNSVMGERNYDVVLCCGVLMYLNEDAATRAIRTMLQHTAHLLGMVTLADAHIDNALLPRSYVRQEDLGFVHNVDQLVRQAGGTVVFRKWTGPKEASRYTRNPPLFTLARPGA